MAKVYKRIELNSSGVASLLDDSFIILVDEEEERYVGVTADSNIVRVKMQTNDTEIQKRMFLEAYHVSKRRQKE